MDKHRNNFSLKIIYTHLHDYNFGKESINPLIVQVMKENFIRNAVDNEHLRNYA